MSDAEAERLWQDAPEPEAFLRVMREKGAFQAESLVALRKVAHISLGHAKQILHNSATWKDCRSATEELQESGVQALEQWQKETPAFQRLAS